MLQNDFFNYILIGLGIGLFFQVIHDIVIRTGKITEEELPDFTLDDHIKLVLLWPIILLITFTRLLFSKR